MGCCLSSNRNSGDTSPYGQSRSNNVSRTGTHPTDSRVPIAQTTQQSSGTGHNQTQISTSSLVNPTNSSNSNALRQSSTSQTNLHPPVPSPAISHLTSAFRRFSSPPTTGPAGPPNKPLQPAPAAHLVDPPAVGGHGQGSTSPACTAVAVRRARAEFFDTRVSGRPEMWAAVRLVCDLVGRGELLDAQAVLDAAGGTCPSGMLWGRRGGCYDERGERYVVPVWCVGWPDGVPLSDDGAEGASEKGERGKKSVWKEGKGKGRAIDDSIIKGKEIKVRSRLSHTARDIIVKTGDEDNVSLLVQRLRSSGEVPVHSTIRIGYMGRVLHEDDSLAAQGWKEGHVINVFVFE